MSKIEVSKEDLLDLIDYAIEFDDVAMNSYYATDERLQRDSKSLNELIYKMIKEHSLDQ